VRLVAGEGRHFVRTTQDQYDLIQLTGVDTLSAMNSGAYVLAENYLYTVEAFHDYLDHLAPGGILSFSTGNLNPGRPRWSRSPSARSASAASTVPRTTSPSSTAAPSTSRS
jgi:spermidine synthase